MRPGVRELIAVCRADAARWVDLSQRVDVLAVTPAVFARLFIRYLPLRATTWFRIGGFLRQLGVPGAAILVQHHLLRAFGLDLPVSTSVGPGLYIAHTSGCTISAEQIGSNVTIIGAITIGYRKRGGGPTIGDEVFVGSGARILGEIVVGERANIGANAVVTKDVPADHTAVGIPARMIAPRPSLEPGAERAFGRG